jgi:hypothetical protein
MLWAAFNLTGDQGTMPVDQWAAVFASDVLESISAPDTQPDDFRAECREWLAKRIATNQATAKPPETVPASPAEAAPPAPSSPPPAPVTEEDKGKAKRAWEQYTNAVADYSRAKAFLMVGKRAQEYVEAKVKPLTDAGEKRSMRGQCVKRCQGELDDSLDSASFKIDAALRAWGVATVYGEEQAFKLPRGKVEAFVPTVVRDKAEESWSIDPALTAEQQTALRSLWTELANGADLNADVAKSRVRSILKPPAQQTTEQTQQTAQNGAGTTQATQGEQKPASGDSAAAKGQNQATSGQTGKQAESSKPQGAVAPKNPADLAEHFAACLKDRTDTAAVWQAFGKLILPSKLDMEGFIHGLLAQGPKQATVDALRAFLSAAGNAISTLARQMRDSGNPPQSAAA